MARWFAAVFAAFMLSATAVHAQSNMGWPTGYIPTAAEWAQSQSSKRDYSPTIPACTWTPCQPVVSINNGLLQSNLGTLSFSTALPNGLTIPNATFSGTTSINALTLTTPLPTASGGSGVASPSVHSVLIAEGNMPFDTVSPGMAGKVMISQGTADPAFEAISGDLSVSSSGAAALTAINGSSGNCTFCTFSYDTKGRVTSVSSGSPPSSIPGGASGQTQYNNSGVFGAYTPSGACTVSTSTGVYTCFGTSNSTLAFSNLTGTATLAQIQPIGVGFLGNLSGSAAPSLITTTQTTAALNACTSALKGMVPSPPNNANIFLNGTCNWSTPAGSGNFSGPSVATSGNLVSFNGGSGTLGQDSGINQSSVVTTTGSQTIAASRLTGQLSTTQMLPLSSGSIYYGNGSNQPVPTSFANLLTSPPPIGLTTSNSANFSTLLAGSASDNPIPSYDTSLMTVTGVVSSGTYINNNGAGVFINDNLASVGPGNSQNAVLYYGVGIDYVNSAWTWGLNPVLADAGGITNAALQNEFDFNVGNASTTVYGLLLQGASTAQPTGTYPAIEVAPLDVQDNPWHIQWSYALESLTAASGGILLGPTGFGASIGSQPIYLGFNNSSNVYQNLSLSSGNYFLNVGLPAFPGNNTGVTMGNSTSSAASTATSYLATTLDGTGQFAEVENGAGNATTSIYNTGAGGVTITPGTGYLSVVGSFNLGNVSGGGAASKYVCVDSSNFVVVQSGPC